MTSNNLYKSYTYRGPIVHMPLLSKGYIGHNSLIYIRFIGRLTAAWKYGIIVFEIEKGQLA